jgi:hypothetical protein
MTKKKDKKNKKECYLGFIVKKGFFPEVFFSFVLYNAWYVMTGSPVTRTDWYPRQFVWFFPTGCNRKTNKWRSENGVKNAWRNVTSKVCIMKARRVYESQLQLLIKKLWIIMNYVYC